MDEDETVEVVTFGGEAWELPIGLEHAQALNRSRYLSGEVEIEEFERELARLLRKSRWLGGL